MSAMISTVTTTTVTTIVASTTIGVSLGILATVLLISLLGTQEVVSADSRLSLKVFGKYLNMTILPLLVVFGLIAVLKIAEAII
jgi:hypothetical protein